jgi:hypothetical protein
MNAHSKQAHNATSAEKSEHADKGISAKQGKISGISKTRKRLRGIKLAAAATVAVAAGLAATLAPTPASARTMSSITAPTDFSLRSAKPSEPEGYIINLPDEFAAFPKAESVSGRVKSLEQENKKFFIRTREDGKSVFEVKDSSSSLTIFIGKSSAIFRPLGSEGFMLDFSPYVMQNPVAKMEKGKGGKVILHLLDATTNTDLTLSFYPSVSSVEEIKAKAYREGTHASQSDPVSKNIAGIINLGEELLEQEKPKTIEEAREVYSRMGAEMVNELREEYSAAPPEQAPVLAKRGQAVITAVLLRLYISDDEDALMELDRLRADPTIDKKKLEGFAWKNGVLDEFQKIWPQCSASYEE